MLLLLAGGSALVRADAGSLKDGTINAGRVALVVIGGLGGAALIGFVVFCLVRREKRQQEQEEEGTAKRSLPETLLDEMEFETPLTLASTAVNGGIEGQHGDDLLDDIA
jgi:hypothetical protein